MSPLRWSAGCATVPPSARRSGRDRMQTRQKRSSEIPERASARHDAVSTPTRRSRAAPAKMVQRGALDSAVRVAERSPYPGARSPMSGSDVSDTTSADGYHWEPTNAPVASSRTDDIWFADAQRGWAVNSNGHVLHTADGGATWTQQLSAGGAYLRCIGFAGDQVGWVGSLAENRRLFHTTDGGATWSDVANLPAGAPLAICGLSVVSEDVVYGSGSNFPDKPAALIKTVDGGATWTAIDLGAQATMLIDVHFSDADHGWVVGGHAGPDVPHPEREDVTPVVLATQDGGQIWTDRLESIATELQQGEWG